MVATSSKAQVPTPEAALLKGFVKVRNDIGRSSLNFSTLAQKNSLILRRNPIDAIVPSGFLNLVSIYTPEHRTKFSVEIDAFVFDGPVEAQPCADEALLWRDYSLTHENGQHGLLIGGGFGLKQDSSGKVVGNARSYAVVRGRTVIVAIMQSAEADGRAMEEDADIFVANMQFDDGMAPAFLESDIARASVHLASKPLELSYPKTWTISDHSTSSGMRSGSFIFTNGDPAKPSSIMSFGFRHGDDLLDEALLYVWASRISKEYARQNPMIMGEPLLVSEGTFSMLRETAIANRFYIFSVSLSQDPEPYQIRVAVIGKGDMRFTFSLFTDTIKTANVSYFVNYANGITAFEIAVDSFLHWLIGKGLD